MKSCLVSQGHRAATLLPSIYRDGGGRAGPPRRRQRTTSGAVSKASASCPRTEVVSLASYSSVIHQFVHLLPHVAMLASLSSAPSSTSCPLELRLEVLHHSELPFPGEYRHWQRSDRLVNERRIHRSPRLSFWVRHHLVVESVCVQLDILLTHNRILGH